MRSAQLWWIVVLLAVVSCSGVNAGDKCNASSMNQSFTCHDAQTALECVGGSWAALPCKGPQGCLAASSVVSCDISLNVVGDACSSVSDGRGYCAADGKSTLECRGGVIKQTNVCSQCVRQDGNVICTPA